MDNKTKDIIRTLNEYYTISEEQRANDRYAPSYSYLLDITAVLEGHGEYVNPLYYHCPYFSDVSSVLDMSPELVVEIAHKIYNIIENGGKLREEY